jgi:aspartyl-tRNA(Asn)/glutamyl-tRNA(Gln) amidotransferase subunit A
VTAPAGPSTASGLADAVRRGDRSATEVVEATLAAIAEGDGEVRAFTLVTEEAALRQAASVDETVALGRDPGPLCGVPVALKDNLCTRGIPTTCSSRILEGWRPPYDATVVERLREAGAVLVGKTNMDEFAMGSSTENSATGPTRNPHATDRVPGGSSGGSAAAVAAGLVPVALGSDTGGSVRQPAALCGVVGFKPTYGAVSRYGLVAFASSLDQIGPLTATVADAALVFDVIGGHDPLDSTSLDRPRPRALDAVGGDIGGLTVGVVRELVDAADPDVAACCRTAADVLSEAGAHVEEVGIPEVRLGLSAYYLIAPGEASSNLARYDGVRYGLRVDADDTVAMNVATRTAGFGDEVKRRIMLGTYVLSAGYMDAYYNQALRARTRIIMAFASAYARCDVLIGPTSPTTAFPIGSKTDDLLAMYRNDVCTIPCNLTGEPAVSVPFGAGRDGLPVGVQVLGPSLSEATVLQVAAVLEASAPPTTPPVPVGAGAGARVGRGSA